MTVLDWYYWKQFCGILWLQLFCTLKCWTNLLWHGVMSVRLRPVNSKQSTWSWTVAEVGDPRLGAEWEARGFSPAPGLLATHIQSSGPLWSDGSGSHSTRGGPQEYGGSAHWLNIYVGQTDIQYSGRWHEKKVQFVVLVCSQLINNVLDLNPIHGPVHQPDADCCQTCFCQVSNYLKDIQGTQ